MVQKLTVLGLETLDLKKEMLLPGHSPIVSKALDGMIEDLAKQALINVDVHFGIKDEKMDEIEFRELLLTVDNMRKSNSELKVEYDEIADRLEKLLLKSPGLKKQLNLPEIFAESDVENEKIMVKACFKVDANFTARYFGETDQDKIDILMKRKGFLERFVVLRYNKMMLDFISKYPSYSPAQPFFSIAPNVEVFASSAYYNEVEKIYAIDFVLKIGIDAAETEDNQESLIETCENEIGKITEYINIRTLV